MKEVSRSIQCYESSGRLSVKLRTVPSGMGPNIEMWERILNAMGIATFAIDGFTGRGIISPSRDHSRLGRLNLIVDPYGALSVLAHHPRIDPERIVLMGFSRRPSNPLCRDEQAPRLSTRAIPT